MRGLAPQKKQTDPEYLIFTAPEWGIRAIATSLLTLQRRGGLKTLRQLITKWAPPENNATQAYVRAVAHRIGEDPDAELVLKNDDTLRGLVLAIIWHVNGQQPYPAALIDHIMLLVKAG
ncbi:MAG: hypothetical protein WA777_18510 [Rhodanobacter sp.]